MDSLTHGPDTPELLRRIQTIQNGVLDVSHLNITSLPHLPPKLDTLDCSNTQIGYLPALPERLRQLWCNNTPISSLPTLLNDLIYLDCSNTPIKELPTLPPNLDELICHSTELLELPEFPENFSYLVCYNTPLLLQRGKDESLYSYMKRWKTFREERVSKQRCQERSEAVQEELVSAVWHPRRVEKIVNEYGLDILEKI